MTPKLTGGLPALPATRPVSFLMLEPPPPRRDHPVFVYLDELAPNSRRAMEGALRRIADLLRLRFDGIRWWAIPDRYLFAIREALGSHYSPATANQSLSALRGVVAVALEMKRISPELYHAYLAIPSFPRAPATRQTLSKREIARLLRTAHREEVPRGLRDAALLSVLMRAGLKRSEVAALRLADYERRGGRLRIGDETILLDAQERALLSDWLTVRGQANGPLFLPMRKGGRIERRRMSGQAVAAIVAERAEQAGIGPLSPEDLRRGSSASRA